MNKVKIVLAGNASQYNQWMHENIPSENKEIYRYGSHPDHIQGLIADDVIVIGTFWDDFPHANDMYKLALSRVRD